MIGLFGSALSPVVSYITFGMRFPLLIGILLGNLAGIAIGLLLPPLAAQTLVFHRGFTLYNIGFTSGLIAMTFTAVLRLFSYSIVENTLVFKTVTSLILPTKTEKKYMYGQSTIYYNSFRLLGIREIFDSSGKLTTDFIANSGIGATLINIGLVGLMLSSYVLLVGGQLNGLYNKKRITCHRRYMRFLFDAHNVCLTVGIFIASLFGTFHEITSTGMLVAAVFGTGLAPISGFYGSFYGVIAGVLHIALVHNVSTLHGGLNLYNSGFSTGFVAGILVPISDKSRWS
ncbi:hypothetical protein EfmJHP38_05360 [Enterococcus faecium]|nr:hypothetical protein EfmJHP38_05360 [Enterococcus faecium]